MEVNAVLALRLDRLQARVVALEKLSVELLGIAQTRVELERSIEKLAAAIAEQRGRA